MLFNHLNRAAEVIGDTILQEKAKECLELLDRDIMATPSLYFE